MKYSICKECEIHHYENCRTCYGFGVKVTGKQIIPVSSHEAHELTVPLKNSKCPECHSTSRGMPKKNAFVAQLD